MQRTILRYSPLRIAVATNPASAKRARLLFFDRCLLNGPDAPAIVPYVVTKVDPRANSVCGHLNRVPSFPALRSRHRSIGSSYSRAYIGASRYSHGANYMQKYFIIVTPYSAARDESMAIYRTVTRASRRKRAPWPSRGRNGPESHTAGGKTAGVCTHRARDNLSRVENGENLRLFRAPRRRASRMNEL